MIITTLLENHRDPKRPELEAEHGLSFYIEHDGHIFMSDVGQSGKFADNAKKLGIDLSGVEALAISHYHYDHGGGLDRFFNENKDAAVYLKKAPLDMNYIAESETGVLRYIGLDKGLMKTFDQRIEYIKEPIEILPGIHLLTDIPEVYPLPESNRNLKMQQGEDIKPDTFEHEMVMVIDGDEGLVILTGCGHNGVVNMIAAAHQSFSDEPIQAVIGGFHLMHEEENAVRAIGGELFRMDIPQIYTGHCTGDDSVDVLAEVLGGRLHRLYTGLVLRV
jgi:7,8-dihydropterin-6-yl-methyl-4-(beta-D-ribofuranosyl)aminobenzene 5'-phosphate synthase